MTQTQTKVWRSGAVVWIAGAVVDNREHSHHALQASWAAPGSELSLWSPAQTLQGEGVIVAGGVPHTLSMADGLIALIDSASPLAQRIAETVLTGRDVAPTKSRWSGEVPDAVALLEALSEPADEVRTDHRVEQVLAWLDEMERGGRWSDVTLERATERSGLSQSRFLHLFSDHVGSPWRTYLVWRRALVAIELAVDGATLTEAAHRAGYADSAHLSRQFSALFGITPSVFIRTSDFS